MAALQVLEPALAVVVRRVLAAEDALVDGDNGGPSAGSSDASRSGQIQKQQQEYSALDSSNSSRSRFDPNNNQSHSHNHSYSSLCADLSAGVELAAAYKSLGCVADNEAINALCSGLQLAAELSRERPRSVPDQAVGSDTGAEEGPDGARLEHLEQAVHLSVWALENSRSLNYRKAQSLIGQLLRESREAHYTQAKTKAQAEGTDRRSKQGLFSRHALKAEGLLVSLWRSAPSRLAVNVVSPEQLAALATVLLGPAASVDGPRFVAELFQELLSQRTTLGSFAARNPRLWELYVRALGRGRGNSSSGGVRDARGLALTLPAGVWAGSCFFQSFSDARVLASVVSALLAHGAAEEAYRVVSEGAFGPDSPPPSPEMILALGVGAKGSKPVAAELEKLSAALSSSDADQRRGRLTELLALGSGK